MGVGCGNGNAKWLDFFLFGFSISLFLALWACVRALITLDRLALVIPLLDWEIVCVWTLINGVEACLVLFLIMGCEPRVTDFFLVFLPNNYMSLVCDFGLALVFVSVSYLRFMGRRSHEL